MASTFEVTVRTIDKIWPHPSADRIELLSLKGLGYQLCGQKGLYHVGQKVVYFPVDSQLPPAIIDKLELYGKDEAGNVIRDEMGRATKTMLVGDNQSRIHTVSLRGEISQGFISPLEELLSEMSFEVQETRDITNPAPSGEFQEVDPSSIPDGTDVTVLLGVTKYDAPESILKGAKLLAFPDGVTPFDVESAGNYPDVVELLMDTLVWITEKLEGTNHGLIRLPEGRHAVCARNNEVEELPLDELDENGKPHPRYPGWEAVRSRYAEPWQILLEQIPRPEFPIVPVAIRGELIGPGVPKSFYPVKEPVLRCFAIKVGPHYLDAEVVRGIIPQHMQVPTLAYNVTLREWLAGRTLAEASNGKSLLAPDRLREGIVVVPMVEQKIQWPNGSIKRLMLKQRSPAYLAKEKV